jgi:hypothetical protein
MRGSPVPGLNQESATSLCGAVSGVGASAFCVTDALGFVFCVMQHPLSGDGAIYPNVGKDQHPQSARNDLCEHS